MTYDTRVDLTATLDTTGQANHKDPIADGGKDVYDNIVPMDPKEHHEHHAEDRRRWGGRKK